MDRQQIGMKLALDALGVPLRLDSFAERQIVQKAIYLAQAVGVHLGYHFHWYLRGPYSPALQRDAFGVVAELRAGADESEGWNLDPASSRRAAALRTLVHASRQDEHAQKLELLASVHFLIDAHPEKGNDIVYLADTLQRYGRDVSEREIQQAVEELNRHGIAPAAAAR